MKFTFDRDLLIKEISIAQEIISTKNPGSILSNVLLSASNNSLKIKATDIKVNFETEIPVQVIEEGSTTVYCDKLLGNLNTLESGEIEFNLSSENGDENAVTVFIKPVYQKASIQMKSMSDEKYPDFESSNNNSYFEISSKEFKNMIGQTAFAVSEDETRYFMNGVYIEKKGDDLNLVATDGRRLSFAKKSILAGINDFPSAIVHPKILNIILKHAPEEGNIFVAIVDKMIFFKFGNYKFGSVLLEGKFPDYTRVIPERQEHTFQVEKSDLIKSLRIVEQSVDKKAGRIYFNVSDGKLVISSPQTEIGSAEAEIPCQYSGDDYTIALNYRYIQEPLKVIDSDRIVFEFTQEMKAVTMRSEATTDYFHIIMPMQKE